MDSSIQRLREVAAQALSDSLAALPNGVEVDLVCRFIDAAQDLGPLDHYKHFNQASRDIAESVKRRGSAEHVKQFLRTAIMQSIGALIDKGVLNTLPERVLRHQVRQLERIACTPASSDAWTDLDDDLFQKDFGLATLRLYAAAAQLIDRRCGIPRSLVLREGVLSAPPKLATVLRLGGTQPYFQIHTHLSYLDEFNEAGWNECYLTCRDLYQVHPEVLGMYGSSWFYDPSIQQVSPRLQYLRRVPLSGGADFWLAETEGHFVEDAIATSPTRRKLYEEGKYLPRSFMMLWGKTDQLQWASRNL